MRTFFVSYHYQSKDGFGYGSASINTTVARSKISWAEIEGIMTVALLTAPFFKSIEVGILLLTKILTPLADFMDAWNKKFSGPAPTTASSGLGLTTGGSRPTSTTGGSRPTSTTGYAIPNGLNLLGKRLGGEVSRDGMYYLHRGENVQTSTKSSDAPIVFNISNNLEIGSVADINYLVSMLEKSITDKLTTISRRTA